MKMHVKKTILTIKFTGIDAWSIVIRRWSSSLAYVEKKVFLNKGKSVGS